MKAPRSTLQYPDFSIVVPTCGRVSLFEETLESLSQQTISEFEIIVPDDSPDESDREAIVKLLIEFEQKNGIATKYIHSCPRLFQARNTNQGLSVVAGKWIRILHSDDLLAPTTLEFERQLFLKYQNYIQVIFHWLLPFKDSPAYTTNTPLKLISPDYLLMNTLHSATACPSGLVFSSEVLSEVGFMNPDLRFLCDWDFFYRLVEYQRKRGNYLMNVPPGYCGWRLHLDNVTNKLWFNHFQEHKLVANVIVNNFKIEDCCGTNKKNINKFYNTAVIYRYSRLIQDYLKLSFWQKVITVPKIIRAISELILEPVAIIIACLALVGKCCKPIRSKIFKLFNIISSPIDLGLDIFATQHTLVIRSDVPKQLFPASLSIITLFDNSINLWCYRTMLAEYPCLLILDVNRTRFYEKVINEVLKYTVCSQDVSFAFEDNEHLTLFGLKAIVEKLFPTQFQIADQVLTCDGRNIVRYKRITSPPKFVTESHDGWSFGLLTLGTRESQVNEFINSIRMYCDEPYEILVVTPCELPFLTSVPEVKQIVFTEKDDVGWITRKKNLICSEARYSDIMVCHDRFYLTPDFFKATRRSGFAFGLAAPRIKLLDGRRALDWGVVSSLNNVWSFGGLLDYRSYSPYVYVPGGATIIRKSFWKNFQWCENLFWNEHEDVEFSRRVQRQGYIISLVDGEVIAHADRWIEQNKPIPFDDQRETLYGYQVGEQRIHYISTIREKLFSNDTKIKLKRWLIGFLQ